MTHTGAALLSSSIDIADAIKIVKANAGILLDDENYLFDVAIDALEELQGAIDGPFDATMGY